MPATKLSLRNVWIDSKTIQDILNALGDISHHEVNATVDANGSIQIQDTAEGANKYEFSIETTVKGLDFGDFATVQEGRNPVTVEATVTGDNRLSITQLNYGSKNTFTISGAAELGIQNGVYAGVDISGKINGVEGTGSGQTLTASNSDNNTRGIVINSAITPEELADEGSSQGTITLISGIADKLYNEITSLVSPLEGFLQVKIDSLEMEGTVRLRQWKDLHLGSNGNLCRQGQQLLGILASGIGYATHRPFTVEQLVGHLRDGSHSNARQDKSATTLESLQGQWH